MQTIKATTAWLFAAFMLAGVCSAQPKAADIRISVALSDITDSVIIYPMNKIEKRWGTPVRTLPVNGKATVSLPLAEATNLLIYANRGSKGQMMMAMPMNLFVVGVPGETLTVSGTSTDYRISGSPLYRQYGEAIGLAILQKGYQHLADTLQNMQKQGISQDSLKVFRTLRLQAMTERKNAAILRYIRTNPRQEASVLLLSELDTDGFFEADPLLDRNVKEGRLKGIYETVRASYVKRKQKAEAAKTLAPGAPAPDFTLDDLNKRPVSLSGLRGRYVILDFWGSWCSWCIKGFPDMKKYYDKYKGRIEILGIDCNDTDAKWREAVRKHQLPWLHVRNTDQTAVDVKYAISGYPTKVIVDPEGRIVRIVVGEDPKFYDYLDELMAQ